MLDEKEQQILENQEISQSRAKTFRYWLDTSLVAMAVALLASLLYLVWGVVIPEVKRELIPAIRSWRGVNDQWTETAIKAAPKIDSMLSDGAVTMADLKEGAGRLKTELPGAVADVRELKPGFLRLQNTVDAQVAMLGSTVTEQVRARGEDAGRAVQAITNRLDGEQVTQILANFVDGSNGLKVLTNDADLKQIISESKEVAASTARSGKKVEVALDKGNEILAKYSDRFRVSYE